MAGILIGAEAVARGVVTRHELRRSYRTVFPGVYAPRNQQLSLRHRTEGAWLWSRRRATIAGVAASALHGARWVDDDVPIELVWSNTRPPRGVVARAQLLADDETTCIAGLPVTTSTRTAYDLSRYLPRGQAVARLDALMRAKPYSSNDVLLLAERYPAARGLRRLRSVLPLVDRGAASPKETWLRLLLNDAGLPAVITQIPVVDGYRPLAVLDMGWPEFGVAVEYDGDHHRSDRRKYVKDQWRLRKLADMGWVVIRVIAEDTPPDIIARVRRALIARGWRLEGVAQAPLAG
ncbi:endonuclease domain-containing protein [Mycobacterium sp. HNNTM2301]|uniref:endonuclease domain-containing protein n=1 Tax=Mycobacterium hainanense TaxID=3289775 RepID=UPI0035A659BD